MGDCQPRVSCSLPGSMSLKKPSGGIDVTRCYDEVREIENVVRTTPVDSCNRRKFQKKVNEPVVILPVRRVAHRCLQPRIADISFAYCAGDGCRESVIKGQLEER